MFSKAEKTVVSKETKQQMEAVKQLVNVYDLLNLAQFQGNFSKRVLEATSFVKALHAEAFKTLQDAPGGARAFMRPMTRVSAVVGFAIPCNG